MKALNKTIINLTLLLTLSLNVQAMTAHQVIHEDAPDDFTSHTRVIHEDAPDDLKSNTNFGKLNLIHEEAPDDLTNTHRNDICINAIGYDRCDDYLDAIGGITSDVSQNCEAPDSFDDVEFTKNDIKGLPRGTWALYHTVSGSSSYYIEIVVMCGDDEFYLDSMQIIFDGDGYTFGDFLTAVTGAMAQEPYGVPADALYESYSEQRLEQMEEARLAKEFDEATSDDSIDTDSDKDEDADEDQDADSDAERDADEDISYTDSDECEGHILCL